MTDTDQEEIRKLKKKLEKQEKKNNEIRDLMAMQRTIFANERTLMAYLRTAIALLGGGFAAIKLSGDFYMEMIGIMLMFIGVILSIYSLYRYFHKQNLINRQREEYTHTSHTHAELQEKQASRYGNID